MRKTIKAKMLPSLIILMIIALTILQTNYNVFASSSEIGFYVKAEIPDNQLDINKSYFDLRLDHSEKQTIEVHVTNTSEAEMNFEAKINDASTNSTGSVEYQIEGVRDESLKNSLADIAKIENKNFSVKPKSTYVLKIDLETPKAEFDGELIGGIIITKLNDENQAEGMTINNVYSYVVGLRITENDNAVLPDLELLDVKADVVNYKSAIIHDIRNLQPALLEDATMKIDVYKKGEDTTQWSYRQDILKIAPSSLMKHNMYIDNETAQAGNYVSKIHIKGAQGEWSFEQEFEIKSNEANSLQEAGADLAIRKEKDFNMILAFAALLIVIIILLLIYLIYKTSKADDGDTKQKTDKKAKSSDKKVTKT